MCFVMRGNLASAKMKADSLDLVRGYSRVEKDERLGNNNKKNRNERLTQEEEPPVETLNHPEIIMRFE